jgi:hypothetical protein
MPVTVYQLLREEPELVLPLLAEQAKILIPICFAMTALGVLCGLQLAPPLTDFDGRTAVIFSGGNIVAMCVIVALGIAIGIFRIYNGAVDLACAPIMFLMFIFYVGFTDLASGANRLLLATSSNVTAHQYVRCSSLFHDGRRRQRRSYTFIYTIDARNCSLLKWQLTEPQAFGGDSFRDSPENRIVIDSLSVR